MPTEIKSKAGLKKLFSNSSLSVQEYFMHVPGLIDQYPTEVCLAYTFSRLETGQNMALYCGVVKLHRANAEVARNAVRQQHLTRKKFVELYKTVFDLDLPTDAANDLKRAETIRDKILHGKGANEDEMRNAVARVLEYAEDVNNQLDRKYGLKPYGKLQGFSGNSKKLEKRITHYLLKGMGFGIA